MAAITTPNTSVRVPTLADLRALGQISGVCLSAYLPLKQGWMFERDVLDSARRKLAQSVDADTFLEPVTSAMQAALKEHGSGEQTLAVFRSAEQMHTFRLPYAVDEQASVGTSFHVIPALKCLGLADEFYVVALSQKHARLLRCTREHSEEVELPEGVPTNLQEFTQTDQPDHRLENRAGGGMVTFGTSSDAERKDEYLQHYYNELDKQLQVLLREKPLPMVVAGVDYERALYHRVSEYSNLVPDGVHGAADGLKGGELHARALAAVDAHVGKVSERAMAQFDKAGSERILMEVQDVVRAAADGRVLHLFVADGARRPGLFDAATREIREEHGADEDLLNRGALEAITHGGDVFVLPSEKLPGGGPLAAVLRY